MAPQYRALTTAEIETLVAGASCAADWAKVLVKSGFIPNAIRNCEFSGHIKIGSIGNELKPADHIPRQSGLFNARLHNVIIGDNCHIANVHGWLYNLKLDDSVIIENCGTISCTGETSFGNGCELDVLNEGGGRELKITSRTSAQIAYLNALYRDRTALVGALDKLAEDYSDNIKSATASIGNNTRIQNCAVIKNVKIGEAAVVDGAKSLINGTVDSSSAAPTNIGSDVIAENFIIQQGASVKDGAMLSSTLVGEGSRIGKQFSAENSAFFANCEGYHSEACSILAGPYTVTHHRSTLLIAGMFSFFNAGSATNQSNHMYKLGPVHQGILERGSKTGSGSYLLWPARVGAFSAVMGKHNANFDTTDFPFSYVDIFKGRSTLIPGMNFFTVGTLRDGLKWPQRDRRQNDDKLDLLIFDVLSPFTAQKMLRGKKIMQELYEKTVKGQESIVYKGIHIKRLLLKTCPRYYQMALDMYLGELLIRHIEALAAEDLTERFGTSEPEGETGTGEWVDINGLLCRQSRLDRLLLEIESGRVKSFDDLQEKLKAIHTAYRVDEWNWYLSIFSELYGKELSAATKEDVNGILDFWQKASRKYLNLVANDAKKEFEGNVRTGYGIDGNQAEDFTAVRGNYEDNSFIQQLNQLVVEMEQRYETAKTIIRKSM